MQDIELNDYGSVTYLVGLTDSGVAWLRENLSSEPWQWNGPAIACEPRMAQDIIDLATGDGMECSA